MNNITNTPSTYVMNNIINKQKNQETKISKENKYSYSLEKIISKLSVVNFKLRIKIYYEILVGNLKKGSYNLKVKKNINTLIQLTYE